MKKVMTYMREWNDVVIIGSFRMSLQNWVMWPLTLWASYALVTK